ncbi:MAG: NAD(P)H-hydrate dehydratase [Planctomycetota bacterium]|nr:NAD(P)H-hydrate dehydratase [Planctomycetota bacterium]
MTLPKLPPRGPDSHKGTFGHALLIGGSQGMAGSISLSGKAALRSGAGLVTLAVPDCIQNVVSSYEPSYMTLGLPADSDGRILKGALRLLTEQAGQATATAIGPGLGRSSELVQLVTRLYFDVTEPMVVDADGLNALASQPDIINRPGGPRVLTPHPGEFARLVRKTEMTAEERSERAIDLAVRCNSVVLLKGHRTLITDGHQTVHNTTGNPGMATGGTGDVLTGVITALLCQGLSAFDAAVLGAHVHGLAGDYAAEELGQVSLISSDLLGQLPRAFQAVAAL